MHQAAFLLQEQNLQQVADGFGVRNDAVAQGLWAIAAAGLGSGLEDGQLTLSQVGVDRLVNTQRASLIEQAPQQGLFGIFVQARVIWLDLGLGQQLGDHELMLVRALAQIERGQVKAENLHGAHQGANAKVRDGRCVVGAQRGVHGLQVVQEVFGLQVRGFGRHGVAQGLGARQLLQRGGQAGVDASEGAAIGLVAAVRVVVGRAIGQGAHLWCDLDQVP